MNRSPPRPDRSPPRVQRATSLLIMPGASTKFPLGNNSATTSTLDPNQQATEGGGSSSHVRVVVRIRPMNHEEFQNSRVCLYAEKPDAAAATTTARSVTTSMVGSLLGRLSLASPTLQIGGSGSFDQDELDQGMILDGDPNNPSRRETPNRQLLSPHYSASPMRTQHTSKTVVVEAPQAARRFALDQVLPPSATQQDVYGTVGNVQAVFQGYNVTILAYGQTASGKTFTMMGADADGVIPLAIHDLMEHLPPHVVLKLSCMEIYQDDMRDLLVEAPSKQAAPALKLRDATKGTGVQVRGLTAVKVDSASQVLSLLVQAQERRRTGSTRLNERSSRSHMITALTVANASVNPPVTAKLTLVDLAGSERIKQTQVVGTSLGESIHINTDLFTLGKVVNALCEKSPHVPYRDSKLTRLLKDALGGNCSTTLICCVSPSELYLEESINTLRYAERARSITNSLEQNVVTKASPFELAELRAENQRLRKQVQQLQKLLKGPDVQTLMDKVQHAKELSGEARESSLVVLQQADKWREQLEQAKQQREAHDAESTQSPLAYELSLAGEIDEDSLVEDSDDDSSTLLSLDSATKTKSIQVEVKALTKEKKTLKTLLLEVSNQIESKREDLDQLEDDYRHRRQQLHDEQVRQEKLRDNLAMEVSQLKLKLHLLATEQVRGEEPSTGLMSLLRRSAVDVDSSEVELRTMKKKESDSMTLARELAKSLGEERTRGEELEIKCQELRQQMEHSNISNEALVNRNQVLEEELRRLRNQLKDSDGDGKLTPSTASPTSRDELDDKEEPLESTRCESSQREGPHNDLVKSKVQEILRLADTRMGSAGTCGSMVSSIGTELVPGDENDSPESGNATKFFISNIQDANKCTCETSMFASNAEHVEFYLPILDVSCTCGKQARVSSTNPCALESILRPWQAEFLKSVGVTDAVEFVHAFTQRGVLLASQMRKWRRQNGMLSVKTKSCRVALHIWHKTCKRVVRHVRLQQAQGVAHPQRPEFLEITVSDHSTVSTLGGGSACHAGQQRLALLTIE